LKDGTGSTTAAPAAAPSAATAREPVARQPVPPVEAAAPMPEPEPEPYPEDVPAPDDESYDDIGPAPDFDPDMMPAGMPDEAPPVTYNLQRFEDVVGLFEERREGILTAHLKQDVHLVRFAPRHIEFRPGQYAPKDLANRMGRLLSDWTGERWVVSVSDAEGAPTLAEQREAEEAARIAEANRNPLVNAVKEAFPGAKVVRVVDRPGVKAPDTREQNQS
jgi:DNA polymerase-3 subunit gamma/tau